MMPLHRPTESPSLAFDRDIALIHLADELGYDECFIGEHHSGGWETMLASRPKQLQLIFGNAGEFEQMIKKAYF